VKLYAAGQKPKGQITEVSYMFPRPGPDKTPMAKVSFVTRVGGPLLRRRLLQIAGVRKRSEALLCAGSFGILPSWDPASESLGL
jgi:hypothetical protein